MPKVQNWLIIGSFAIGLGIAASVGGTTGALLGSTTGAVVGATFSKKRSPDGAPELEVLKFDLEQLKSEIKILIAKS